MLSRDVVGCGEYASLLDLLQFRAKVEPENTAYIFLVDGESNEERITYGELGQRALAVAERFAGFDVARQPVLLLFGSGINFIVAFFGVLLAGAIPVPGACQTI